MNYTITSAPGEHLTVTVIDPVQFRQTVQDQLRVAISNIFVDVSNMFRQARAKRKTKLQPVNWQQEGF